MEATLAAPAGVGEMRLQGAGPERHARMVAAGLARPVDKAVTRVRVAVAEGPA